MTWKKKGDSTRSKRRASISQRPIQPPTVIRVRGVRGPVRGSIERQFLFDLHEESLCKDEVRRRITTKDERAMIKNAVWALNDVRDYIGLSPVCLPIRNVHFVRTDHYDEAFGDSSSGRSILRQIFIKDDEEYSRVKTMLRLTHELVHAMAFNQYMVCAENDKKANKRTMRITHFEHQVCGFPCKNDDFIGLNEATTEIIATMARNRIGDDEACPFNKAELKEISRSGAYGPQMELVLKFLEQQFGSVSEPTTWLIWDYLTGTNDFLRHIRRANPTAYQALKLMGDDVQSTYDAAILLDYDELAEDIYDSFMAENDDE